MWEEFCERSRKEVKNLLGNKTVNLYFQTDQLEKLTPLEAKLRQIERLSLSIADGYVYVKKREKGMRRTNGE